MVKVHRKLLMNQDDFTDRVNKAVYYLEEQNHKVKDIKPTSDDVCTIVFECENPIVCKICSLVIK